MDLIKLYKELHKKEKLFQGKQTLIFKDIIKDICSKYNIKTLLDYGCGKGVQYKKYKLHEFWNLDELFLYDIGVEEYSNKPDKKFDMVISIDVIEHIHPSDVENVLTELNDYATKVVFVNIATVPAKKTFPDGTNVHLTVEPKEWWIEKIRKIATKDWYCYFRTEKTRNRDLKTFDREIIKP